MTLTRTVGTLSHGTHRPEDLVPCFLGELDRRDPATAGRIRRDYYPAVGWVNDYDPDRVHEVPNIDPEDVVPELLAALFDALDAVAPAGYYFGAHPGDGADFGFWEAESDPFYDGFEDDTADDDPAPDTCDVHPGRAHRTASLACELLAAELLADG